MKYLNHIISIALSLLFIGTIVFAAEPYVQTVKQGGTGWGNLQGTNVLIGNWTNKIATSTGLTFATSTDTLSTTNLTVSGTLTATLGITGANNMVLSANGSGTIIGTSTPSASHYLATSTTATSTFAGGIKTQTIGTGLVISASGDLGQYQGTTCTNQVATALSVSGAATCTTITSAYVDSSIVPSTRTLTVAGTANQITSSAGAQDLSANRTWTLALPSHVIFPTSYQASIGTTTNATSTNMTVTGNIILSQITSAIVLTGSGGAVAEYTGATCTNQFVRSLDALGAATCATVGSGDVSLANLTATDTTLTFSGTYNGSTARTIGLNLGNANTFTALQTFSGNASTTQLTVTGNTYLATASGNVGIGTTGPDDELEVSKSVDGETSIEIANANTGVGAYGTLKLTSDGGTSYLYRTSNAYTGISSSIQDDLVIQESGGGDIHFSNGSSVWATIKNAGNVGIATTSPAQLFSVGNAIASGGIYISATGMGIGTSSPTQGMAIQNNNLQINSGQISTGWASTTVSSGAFTVNWNSGGRQRIFLNGTMTLTVNATSSNPLDGGKALQICQDSAGSRSLVWATSQASRWIGATPATTTMPTAANTCIFLALDYDGYSRTYRIASSSSFIAN